ncbi:riboflavin synthase alpha chain [Legionella beliardensis]|uniref:Riboflavin synthase n=1 Tax=Legionella beliardensis TaxID=91822 RepID=A0A378I1K5_9GAMM|nr:riboflavin synthase [Legionella beliardensis]STX28611.1 riboflavin synthase alpha chain [Legionella beliardensis]
MFTGLVAQQGEVIVNEIGKVANRLVLRSCFKELEPGESIAVNGVCLTLLPDSFDLLQFDISPETLSLTTLNRLKKGDKVNLERAMLANSRFGGHYVSGHVDTTAAVLGIMPVENFLEITLGDFGKVANLYLLPKGSITIEGVSLTINTVAKEGIKIMLVPHTLANTTLGQMEIGQRVNVEFDYLTRIVAHQLTASGQLKVEV